MANTTGPGDPRRPRGDFMPMWGWAALVIAVIIVFALIFSWGDTGQQQAETPTTTPPATQQGSPPAKSPTTTPPAQQTTPPAKSQ